jgi:hypothetical protein
MRHLGHLLILALALAGGPARAAERLPTVPLDAAGLKRLCEMVRPDSQVQFAGDEVQRGKAREEYRTRRAAALQRFYRVVVPSAGFGFREYEPAEQRLPVEARRPLVVGEGAEVLIPPGEEEPPELDATLPAPAAEQVVRLRAKGKLGLRLTFRLDPGQSGDPCTRGAGHRTRASIDPLAFELVEANQGVLYRAELPGYQEAVYATVPVKGPKVRVARASITGTISLPEVNAAVRALEPGLLACYRRGLENNARLRGALVVGFAVQGGRVGGAHAEINSLGDDATVGCVLDRITAQRFPNPRRGGRVSLPVHFSSEDD